MANPLIVAGIGAVAATVFGALGRQFRAYGSGNPSYLSALQGNPWLAGLYCVVVTVLMSALVTFLLDGTIETLLGILAVFVLFAAAVFGWLFLLKRRER